MRVDVLHLSNSKSLDAPAITCVAKVADSNPDRGRLGMPLNGGTVVGLQNPTQATKLAPATPLKRGPKGPVPKRRHQEGTFRKENGRYYSFFYRDRVMPDGNVRSVKERFDHGKVGEVSELSARREHDRLRPREWQRADSAKRRNVQRCRRCLYRKRCPHLSCSTIRQRQPHLRFHLLPRFGTAALMALDIRALAAIRYQNAGSQQP